MSLYDPILLYSEINDRFYVTDGAVIDEPFSRERVAVLPSDAINAGCTEELSSGYTLCGIPVAKQFLNAFIEASERFERLQAATAPQWKVINT